MKSVVTAIAAGSILWAVPAFAAPPAQPSSSAYVNTFGPIVGGGQTSQAQTQIRNGVVGATYDTTGGSALLTTHSADNYANSAQVTSNTGNFVSAQADLHDGSVHTLSSLGNGAVARAFATSSIGDTVYFNNTSGATAQLSFTFSFSGQYTGDTNSSALAIFSIFGSQGACAEGNYEGSCAGYGPYYNPPAPTLASGTGANQTLQMGYLKSGALVQYGAQQGGAFFFGAPDNLTADYVLSRTYDPASGLLVSDITAVLAIPAGASRLGFDLKLNLDCGGAGSSCDFSHTSTFGFGALPTGLTFSSESGAFLVGNSVGGAVPEPATWAMMILGFGLIGSTMRSRAKVAKRVSFVLVSVETEPRLWKVFPMKHFSLPIAVKGLALASAALLSSTSHAAVTYSFSGEYTSARDANGDPIATETALWTFTTANFITAAADFTPQSCVTNNVNFACSATQRAEPYPNGFGAGVLGDYIGLNLEDLLNNGSGTGFYFFQPGALGQTGVFTTIDPGGGYGNAGRATLTVSSLNSAVPEPATWAMMIGGFGAIGGTVRYRRRKTSISFA